MMKNRGSMELRKIMCLCEIIRLKCIEILHVTRGYGALGHAEGTEDWPEG